MNYYNYPYMGFNNIGYARPGIFSSLFKNGINWGTILDNGQRTLNLINQSIPIIKQAQPIYKNARTMFKVMNEFKKVDNTSTTKDDNQTNHTYQPTTNPTEDNKNKSIINNDNGPTFFL